jgi:DNA-binding FadR family transcriptional regulator
VIETYSLRALLEGYAAAIAAVACPPDMIARMHSLVAQMKEAGDKADFVAFSEADLDFHDLLCSATDHSRLVYLSQCLRTQMGFLAVLSKYSPPQREGLVQDHRLLLEAIQAQQPEQARQIIQRHIHTAGQLFVKKFFPQESPSRTAEQVQKLQAFWSAVKIRDVSFEQSHNDEQRPAAT